KTIAITTEDLRDNLPTVRSGIQKGTQYVLLYRGRPIAEINKISNEVDAMFFDESDKIKKLNPDAERIKKKVAGRKKKRIKKNE
ncbi:hypothetical protein KJ918_00820, partial [Patescibacteria group bacterium]|nr:hypothetical protein [Patescibacteria group bacterium]